MKVLKQTLTLFALLGALSTTAVAQETADVNVTATVQAVLNVTPTDVSFGTIQQAAATIAAPSSGGSNTNVGTTASAGALQIQGTTGVDVTVSWTNAILGNGTAGEEATFTPSVWNSGTELTNSGGSTVNLVGGDVTLEIGGDLTAPTGTGSYTTVGETPITFTVQYN